MFLPTSGLSVPLHLFGLLLCSRVSLLTVTYYYFANSIINSTDIPEFLSLTATSKDLRYGIKLFTQCQTEWDKETEKHFYITRLVMLYMYVGGSVVFN